MKKLAWSLLLAVGCGSDPGGGVAGGVLGSTPPATLTDDPAVAKQWATGSAPSVLELGEFPYLLAQGQLQLGKTCPTKTVNGDVTTYDGNGCAGWSGTAKVTGEPSGSGSGSGGGGVGATPSKVEFDAFSFTTDSTCNNTAYHPVLTYNGTVTGAVNGNTGGAYVVDVKYDYHGPDKTNNCAIVDDTFGMSYHGTLTPGPDANGDGKSDYTTWAGTGKLGSMLTGVVDVATTDEVINNTVCKDEAASGTTTIKAGGHTITITYDGATKCDTSHTVQWAYDGQPRGEISGVQCNAGGGGGSGVAVIALGVVLAVRRRRRPRA